MQATVMVVSVTASTTAGQPLSDDNLQKLLHACDVALQLDKDKADILKLVQMKMHNIAPNLSAAVGTEIAARLMGIAGGLTNLSKMPACNVQVRRLLKFPYTPRLPVFGSSLLAAVCIAGFHCLRSHIMGACRCLGQRGSISRGTPQQHRACMKASSLEVRSYR